MSVRFVIGRAGCGKTRWCFDSIVKQLRDQPLGPPIYWLLPRQATFDAQRELATTSGLGGFCRARILSFSEFGREIIEHCGGSSIPEITPVGRQMVLGHLLRQLEPRLSLFGQSARRTGLAAQLDETFAELERCGKGSEDLARMIEQLQKTANKSIDGEFLLAKLQDLLLVYDEYNRFLGQERLDQHRRASQVVKLVETCAFLRDCVFYVDGFLQFAENERQMLAAISSIAQELNVCLLMNPGSRVLQAPREMPDEMGLFHRTEQTYRRLFASLADRAIEILPPILLRDQHRFARQAAIVGLEGSFDYQISPVQGSDAVEFIVAPNREVEADAVARQIKSLIASGYRLREIAVLVRNLDSYADALSESFAEHEIPFFVDRRRSADHHPLLRALRCLVQIARYDWPGEAVLMLMKSGLVGIESEEADAVENYLLSHFIRGRKDWCSEEPWVEQDPTAIDEETDESTPPTWVSLVSVDRIRRKLVRRLGPVIDRLRASPELPLKTIAVELFTAFDVLGVQTTLEQWIARATEANKMDLAAEHERVWVELVKLTDEMVSLLDESRMSLEQFSDVLEAGLAQFDLGLTPPTVDQVLIGQVDRSRTPEVRAVFVMGLVAGEFPQVPSDTSILSDRERRELARLEVELDPDSRQRTFDERLLGYIAFTRASEKLFLSRTVAESSKTAGEPSVFWNQARALLPEAELREARPAFALAAAEISTPRQLVAALMDWAQGKPQEHPENTTLAPLYEWFRQRPCRLDAIDDARHFAWRALSYHNQASLSSAVRERLFPATMTVTARQLERFAACPFQHFARHSLGLRQRPTQEIGFGDLAGFYNRLLLKLMDRAIHDRLSWDGPEAPISEQTIQQCLNDIDDVLAGYLRRGGERGKYLLERTRTILHEFVLSQQHWMMRSQFRPAFSDLRYGRRGQLPPLTIQPSKEHQVRIEGTIDRVDRLQNGNHLAALQYGMSTHGLRLDEVEHGLSLRLLTHLLALAEHGEKIIGQTASPAASLVVSVPRWIVDVDHPANAKEETHPEFHLSKARGLVHVDQVRQLDKQMERSSAVLQVQINKDNQIGNRGRSDAADAAEFVAILKFARSRLESLAGRLVRGDISISPYRMGDQSPCGHCSFASVCRFHISTNEYRFLEKQGRTAVLDRAREQNDE